MVSLSECLVMLGDDDLWVVKSASEWAFNFRDIRDFFGC